MTNNLSILKNVPLFAGINDDIEKLINCLNPVFRTYTKNSIVFLAGDKIHFIGIVLSGGVRVIKEDYLGNTNIVTELGQSEIFGETFVCAGKLEADVSIRASGPTEVLFVDYRKVITTCQSACPFHTRLVFNMMGLIAHKNNSLCERLDVLSQRTTREKLLTYFHSQAKLAASNNFSIPFNRAELSDYLCVDRSAMSRELCKMRDEGEIEFYKNVFVIKEA